MNLEQIDTSTTAGKAEVMRLAAEGREIAFRAHGSVWTWIPTAECNWNWSLCDYAIIRADLAGEGK